MAELDKLTWRTSGRCNNGDCVEVAMLEEEVVVRDSKDRHGLVLRFTAAEWRAFLAGVHAGEFEFNQF
jgi:hypothetical protein